MGGGSDMPQPPNPWDLFATDISTIKAQNYMNNVNVVSPFGSSTFHQILNKNPNSPRFGKVERTSVVGPDGRRIFIPKMQQTISLSPEEQAKYDLQNQLQMKFGNIALNQADQIDDLLSTPFDPGDLGQAPVYDRDKYQEALFHRLQPMIDQDRQKRDAQLAGSGVGLGSDAYEEAIRLSENAVTDARYQAILQAGEYAGQEYGQAANARERAIQEALLKREVPLREMQALMGNVELNMPQFAPWRGSSLPSYSDIAFRSYEDQLKAYQIEQQQQQAAMSGAFGLGQSLIGGLFSLSDRRAKFDIVKLADDPRGFGIYSFRYIFNPVQRQIGVMAQEVASIVPEAVTRLASGLLAVNYGALYDGR